MGNVADQQDSKEKEQEDTEDYSKLFEAKPFFGEPDDFGVIIKVNNNNNNNNDDDNKDDNKDGDDESDDDDDDDDELDDDEEYEEECYIIMDELGRATEETYILKKDDFASWSVNKIIKKSNFDELLKINNNNLKQLNENSAFWKFLKEKLEDYEYKNCLSGSQKKNNFLRSKYSDLVQKMSFDEIAAIFLYTTNRIYRDLNNSLRQREDKYAPFCGPLLSGLSKLPFEWKKLYRGIAYKPLVDRINKDYKQDMILRFDSFTSTTTDLKIAKQFAGNTPSTSCIFEIESGFRGRDIAPFSAFNKESEILFNISSHFVITKIYKGNDGRTWVRCKELPFPWDSKTILWIDDKPTNNKELMEQFEKDGVMIIPRISTYGAVELLDFIVNAININTFNQFRVITDMHRMEYVDDDNTKQLKEDKDAGITLIKALRNKGYKNKVCIYTAHKDITIAKCKKDKEIKYDPETIIVTESKEEVIQYATFNI